MSHNSLKGEWWVWLTSDSLTRIAKLLDRPAFIMAAGESSNQGGTARQQKEPDDHQFTDLSCQEITTNRVDPKRHSDDAVFCGLEETALYLHCTEKFDRECGKLTPRLVGYVPNFKDEEIDERRSMPWTCHSGGPC
ncbi:MAG: hypothetical protein P8182_07265 [Deltaproteobacteria bacterium]